MKSNLDWTATVPGAQALCAGDWENDGGTRVLVAAGSILDVLDLTGTEISKVQLPDHFMTIECGRNKADGARLLGYTPWGKQVLVIDHEGKRLWDCAASFGVKDGHWSDLLPLPLKTGPQRKSFGVTGAHWGDLDGDGNDAMFVGMNAVDSLEALSASGKKRWSANVGVAWCQAIVPAAANRPALVVATAAGGSVNLFDAAGQRKTVSRPSGGYFTGVAARAVGSNSIRILAFAANAAVAFDTEGNVAWTSSAMPTMGYQRACCAAGDFKGDGTTQWVFLDGTGDLVLATTDGKKAGWIPKQSRILGLAVAPRPGQGDLLLILQGVQVQAYSWKK
jgi:hypothetical protein